MIRTVRMFAIVFAVVMSAIGAASADSPKFHPAPGAMPVIGRYVVTLADSVAEDLVESSVRGVAMTYNGHIEAQPSSNVRQFAISMAPSRARTLSADPRVREVVEIPQSDEAGSAAPSAPSRADLSRHGFVPAAQDSPPSATYLYDGAGNIKAIGSDTFVYDSVGRLKQATVQGSQQSYDYDAFGNRILATRGANAAGCVGGCEAPSTVFGQSNHLTGATYDVAGNVTSINGAAYAYDGSGMVTRATAGGDDRMFIYTADDERIGVRNGVSWTWTVRDLSGKVLREFTSLEAQSSPLVLSQHTWSKDYAWRDGLLLASVFPTTPGTITPTTTYHYHLDHLGTPLLITGNDGVLVAKHTYYPFGAEMDITPHESATELMKFTGHERDVVAAANASVDYMHARYYNGNLGRFLSVDPVLGVSRDPQSWNRYAYVRDNPIGSRDPRGLCGEAATFIGPTEPCRVHLTAGYTKGEFYDQRTTDFMRYHGAFSREDGTATEQNVKAGFADRAGVSVFIGHAKDGNKLGVTKGGSFEWLPFSSIKNKNGIACIAACNSTEILKNARLSPGQTLITVTSNAPNGFIVFGNLQYIGTQIVDGLASGKTAGQIVAELNQYFTDVAKKDPKNHIVVSLIGNPNAMSR